MKSKNEYQLTQGPLPKSLYTYQFEDITRKMMNNEDYQVVVDKNEDYIEFKDGSIYNLTKVFKHANFTHLEFNKSDLDNYEAFSNNSLKQNSKAPQSTIPKNSFPRLRKQYPHLSDGEMNAVNIYTQKKYYRDMNSLLRGTYPFRKKNNKSISNIIIHSAILGSALTKIPLEEKNKEGKSYRVETQYSKEVHNARKNASSTKGVVMLRGFISTTTNKELSKHLPGDVVFTFTNLIGQNIDSLSEFPHERERLLPPTQIQINNYGTDISAFEEQRDSFEVSPARDIKSVSPEDLLQKSFINSTQTVLIELEDFLEAQIIRLENGGNKWYMSSEKTKEKLEGFRACLVEIKELKKTVDEISNELNLELEYKINLFNKVSDSVNKTLAISQIQRSECDQFKQIKTQSEQSFSFRKFRSSFQELTKSEPKAPEAPSIKKTT